MSLEGLADKIQQGIDKHLSTQRQQELERRNAEVARMTAEVARKTEAAQEQRAFEQKSATAIVEARKILDHFQIEEKLKYIRRNVWKGKGRIRSIEPKLSISTMGFIGPGVVKKYDRLGGLELVHQYPLPVVLQRDESRMSDEGKSYDFYWQYVPETSGTSISIVALKQIGSREGATILRVGSEYSAGQRGEHEFGNLQYRTSHRCYFIGQAGSIPDVYIPVESQDSKALLDLALVDETNYRLANNLLPSQLEERAKVILAAAKRKPCWQRWTSQGHDLWPT